MAGSDCSSDDELAQRVAPLVRSGCVVQAARQKGGVWFPACYRAFIQRIVPLDTPTMRYVFCAGVTKITASVRLELLQVVPARGGLPNPSILVGLRNSLSEALELHIRRYQRPALATEGAAVAAAAGAPPPPPPPGRPPPSRTPTEAVAPVVAHVQLAPTAELLARSPVSPRGGGLLPGESEPAARALLELEARAATAARAGTSALERSMLDVLAACQPTAADGLARTRLLEIVRKQARALGAARAEPFGSSMTDLHANGADLDVCVVPSARGFGSRTRAIHKLAAYLRAAGMHRVEPITRAKVPIVKFVEPRSQLECDVGLGNVLALRNTALVCAYLATDARMRPLALAVKHWARARNINEPSAQTLSSYAYVLLVVGYLQCAQPAVLPCLQARALCAGAVDADGRARGATPEEQALIDEIAAEYGADLNVAFCADARAARAALGGALNGGSLGALLRGFFRWYGREFRVEAHVVSVRRGGLVTRAELGWPNANGHWLCIEDPFDTSHDLGRVLTQATLARVRREFARAVELCEDAALTFDELCEYVD
jgi:DNA polymerase sigma